MEKKSSISFDIDQVLIDTRAVTQIVNQKAIEYNRLVCKAIDNLEVELMTIQEEMSHQFGKMEDKFSEHGERLARMESSLDDIKRDLADIRASLKFLPAIQADTANIKATVSIIQSDVKDLPAIRSQLNTLDSRLTWWRQYLIAPLIVAAVIAFLKYVLHW